MITAKTPCALFTIPTACVTSTKGGSPITEIIVEQRCSNVQYVAGKIQYLKYNDSNPKDASTEIEFQDSDKLIDSRDRNFWFSDFDERYYSNVTTTVLSNCDDNTYTIKACPTIPGKPMVIGTQTFLPCSPYYNAEVKDPNWGCDAPVLSLTPQADCLCKGEMSILS